MPGTVKDFSVSYDAVNEDHTFTCGDYIKGRVVLQLGKEAKIDYLFIKVKGDADVRWTERHGDEDRTYSAHERYFKLKQMLISEETENTMVLPGSHVYPFCLQIPEGNFPSSFEGHHGNIRYKLEAKMKRSWKMTKQASAKLNFVTRLGDLAQLMSPQFGEKDKKMNLFTSGSLSFKAQIEKTGYVPGEMLIVQAEIENASSRNLKPKYKLDKKVTYIAHSSTKIERGTIFKEEGSPVPSKDHQTVTQELMIPTSLPPSILFCKILRVEYKLKVYIDVPYGSDPEIKFPMVILPASRIGPRVSGAPAPFGHSSKPQWNNQPPQPGACGPPPYVCPPAPGQYPNPVPPVAQPAAAGAGPYPPPFYNQVAYPGPAVPPPAQPNTSDHLPPPQYDLVTNHPTPTAPPLYPTLPAPDFLSSPSAPQHFPGTDGYNFLSNPSAPQQYPVAASTPFLSSPDAPQSTPSNPGYDPPTYEMVFPTVPVPGSSASDPSPTKPPS